MARTPRIPGLIGARPSASVDHTVSRMTQTLSQFLQSPAAALPATRPAGDFETFLLSTTNQYVDGLKTLDPSCSLAAQASSAATLALVGEVSGWVRGAVRQYLLGQPERAYRLMRRGIHRLANLNHLVSLDIPATDIGPLYRMTRLQPHELSRKRLFHVPFSMRHLVGKHRYGIAGFPCLYLGGSLRICQLEIDVPDNDLKLVGIARFEPTRTLRVLDLGYKPSVVAKIAQARAASPGVSNPALDAFIQKYVICWPILAACSVQRLYAGHFAHEYIVPQLLLQWVMRETMCDGIRYFSTRGPGSGIDVHGAANYVFPALPPAHDDHSSKLRARFVLTDPCMWRSGRPGATLDQEFADNETHLGSLSVAQV